ncbi:MAG: hypothetical protein COV35_05845 [Alphaproteobacteria bacterium CG11_big_fil_rev_8_21_14_0_20_39_49]|nr:MAG: hypothetical protein COV35_05845 [Alphaproteobacteria bacterium CG11_big_fil_rev_8_21_14_0_20_39_49]
METKQIKESQIAFALVASVVAIIEYIALTRIILKYDLLLFLNIHFLVLSGLFIWISYFFFAKRNLRFPVLLFIMTATTGFFGAILCLIASLSFSHFVKKADSPSQWITNLFNYEHSQDEINEKLAYEDSNISLSNNVKPFQDVINFGTMAQKQIAITKMTKHFLPKFAPTLIKASKDNNAAVRVQAAAALAAIERRFMSEYMLIEKSLKDKPYHDGQWLKLAAVCEEYSLSGLLDSYSVNTMQLKIIKIYEAYLPLNNELDVKIKLAKMYMWQNEYDKALDLLATIVQSDKIPSDAVLLYVENLFYLKKFHEIRTVIKQYCDNIEQLNLGNYDDNLTDIIQSWKSKTNNIVHLYH